MLVDWLESPMAMDCSVLMLAYPIGPFDCLATTGAAREAMGAMAARAAPMRVSFMI
jgi:hypothetical protein